MVSTDGTDEHDSVSTHNHEVALLTTIGLGYAILRGVENKLVI